LRSRAAATNFMAMVICCVLLTLPMRRRIVRNVANRISRLLQVISLQKKQRLLVVSGFYESPGSKSNDLNPGDSANPDTKSFFLFGSGSSGLCNKTAIFSDC
jgi:hypothetical protein